MSEATIATPQQAVPDSRQPANWLIWNFAGTVLVSAFLLFQVQPLISKFILPWFGGSPAVWTTCMLFFQVLLFAGYTYAHLSQTWLRPRAQAILHAVLLLAAVSLLPITPAASWKPPDSSEPTWRILRLLTVCVGLPYFALSATGPLLQAWFSRAYPGRSPYRLYALSNAGSLVALLSYPFVFEPAFDVFQQVGMWSIGFALFAALCAACAIAMARRHRLTVETPPVTGDAIAEPQAEAVPSLWRRAVWLGLPACASLMLLATTNHVCQDVAVIPFLWVVPLSLYLLTFIICFDHQRWYVRPLFAGLAILSLVGVATMWDIRRFLEKSVGLHYEISYVDELVVYFTAMFCVCMLCHGELVRSRPGPRYLTEFYLLISGGGALGGIFVSLIAPEIFRTYFEWKIAIVISYGLAIGLGAWSMSNWLELRPAWVFAAALPIAIAGPTALTLLNVDHDRPVAITRNFYGVVSVWDENKTDPEMHYFSLMNGRIVHGRQFVDPKKSRLPIAYYPYYSGVGQAVTYFQDLGNVRVGTVGLGVGTMAAYARPGDYFRFYEINPQVLSLATRYFTYLSNCRGKHDVVLEDARLALEREKSQGFHVLVLDAFSGDAIPTHLLTSEAIAIYLKHLRPDGVLAVHITNKYLDLQPVVETLAEHFDLGATLITVPIDDSKLCYRSDWMLLTRNKDFLEQHPPELPSDDDPARKVRLWTDHYSNLFEILQ